MIAHIIERGVTLCGQELPIKRVDGPTEMCVPCCKLFVAERHARVKAVADPPKPPTP